MSEIKPSKTENRILTDAAGKGGIVAWPETMKPVTQERLIGRFVRDGLILADGEAHRLTPVGYRAVGLEPPRTAVSKKALVAELLGRAEGASISELIAATGWLPHTTRAVLSRLRSAGQELTKAKRQDGMTAYRLAPEAEPATQPKQTGRARAGRARAVEEVRDAV